MLKTNIDYKTKHDPWKYIERFLNESYSVRIYVTWNIDEQQAEPFHKEFNSDEFIYCLSELLEAAKKLKEDIQ